MRRAVANVTVESKNIDLNLRHCLCVFKLPLRSLLFQLSHLLLLELCILANQLFCYRRIVSEAQWRVADDFRLEHLRFIQLLASEYVFVYFLTRQTWLRL